MALDGIDGLGGSQRAGNTNGATPEQKAREVRSDDPRPAEEARDRVELSDEAKRIARLAEKAAALPEIREARVAELREALARGTYRPEATEVARLLLEFEDDLAR